MGSRTAAARRHGNRGVVRRVRRRRVASARRRGVPAGYFVCAAGSVAMIVCLPSTTLVM
jgi:hypothetical protein